MKKLKKKESTYVMVYTHNDETCSLPPPPESKPVRRTITLLIKLFRLYTGL